MLNVSAVIGAVRVVALRSAASGMVECVTTAPGKAWPNKAHGSASAAKSGKSFMEIVGKGELRDWSGQRAVGYSRI